MVLCKRHSWWTESEMSSHGPLARYVKIRVAHAPGMPGTFSPAANFKGNYYIAIPACITARAWRTCRDACRDRLPAVTGKTFPAFPAHAQPQFCVSGKRPMDEIFVSGYTGSCHMSVPFWLIPSPFFKIMHPKMLSVKWQPFCFNLNVLPHWGRVAHLCISKITIIGSDNGLSSAWLQAIIWTIAGILSIRTLGTNVSEILCEIHTFSFKKKAFENFVCKMAAISSWPQSVNPDSVGM